MYKKAQNPIVVIVVMVALAAAVIGGFFLVRSIGDKNREVRKSKTEVEKLMELDLDNNYPGTAREVLKINNRLMKCYYNEELNDDQIKVLAAQNQKLFDEELLKRNPYDTYLPRLKKEIEGYKKSKVTIINIGLQELAEAETEERGGYKFCNLLVSFFLKEGNGHKKTNHKYYLREDKDGKWKILFWEVTKRTF
ncbi:MAG: DUF6715 family protein [Catonella sp.]|uniref:DUF6715 family protein n=1 Tax=Catonella sp. TaxID=2382125 RepID=UPI003F9FA124